jgi:hypothetical protein
MSTGDDETSKQQDDSGRELSGTPTPSPSTGTDNKPESDVEKGPPVENEKDSAAQTVCSEH